MARFSTRSTLWLFALCLLPFSFVFVACSSPARSPIAIALTPDAASGQTIVRVSGLSSRELSALRGAVLTEPAWGALLSVSVTGTAGITVAGRYEAAAAGVEF